MKRILQFNLIFWMTVLSLHHAVIGQKSKASSLLSDTTFSGIKFRSIGPAFMSGRIADIAIHPVFENTWYVAVGSGGVWKTENAGTTWTPIFDHQTTYSTGCVTIDPSNPHTIWVGTGENVGGRHVGFGDGIYKSEDDGKTWKNMGLKNSEHISKVIVHPENSDVVWVAAQGPLWSKGGERGLYMTSDGGENWQKVLGDNEWTGVTDIVIDPRNPDWIYAATWQRHRTVAAYMGGGPGSGLHRSTDGGKSWTRLKSGLPSSNMGKIGLAISPQKPDILYAAIELDRRSGGVYKSTNKGMSWEKMSDAVSGATGPHYYQELYASPHHFDRLYLVDVRMQISDDGGKTFYRMKEEHKHSDNHAIAFKKSDPNYLLVGTDGGIYESFDLTENWRFISNLPITQYYKVAVDDATPFYNIYGGTQDNNTHGGPSRTTNVHGIRNADWFITLFGDGHQPATEPGNPDIIYSEWQQGNLTRVDRTTGEIVYIKPQPEADEDYERYNWDAPILVSPHDPKRLYFASQRVWRSDNRGDSWTAISGDLSKNQNRLALPIMGRTQSWDEPWDMWAMSNYNTITSLAESPKKEGLIYAGTDDGLIQVTENGGQNWRKIAANTLPGVPTTAFVNDVKADLFDENTAYVALDNHKYGDYKPYLFKTTDKGKSWRSISANLPVKTLVWRIVQDHVQPGLLFAATEFGIYFTIDGGGKWMKLKGNVPTISFRDLAIQRRENDLVAASFGRGFYVLDDYSMLRNVSEDQLNQEATLFASRKAWWYIQKPVLGFSEKASQGAAYYTAPNPEFGATFTYYLKEDLKSSKDIRKQNEKKLIKANKDVPFPGWKALEAERRTSGPKIWLTVKNKQGEVVRRLSGSTKKGFHRIAWDLRYPAASAISLNQINETEEPTGLMAGPGTYSVSLSKEIDGVISPLSTPQEFEVEQLNKGALPGASPEETVAFWRQMEALQGEISAATIKVRNGLTQLKGMRKALYRTTTTPGDLDKQLFSLMQDLYDLDHQMNGDRLKQEIGEGYKPTVGERLGVAYTGTVNATYGPTPLHKRSFDIAKTQFEVLNTKLDKILNEDMVNMAKALEEVGAPWVEGQVIGGK